MQQLCACQQTLQACRVSHSMCSQQAGKTRETAFKLWKRHWNVSSELQTHELLKVCQQLCYRLMSKNHLWLFRWAAIWWYKTITTIKKKCSSCSQGKPSKNGRYLVLNKTTNWFCISVKCDHINTGGNFHCKLFQTILSEHGDFYFMLIVCIEV